MPKFIISQTELAKVYNEYVVEADDKEQALAKFSDGEGIVELRTSETTDVLETGKPEFVKEL